MTQTATQTEPSSGADIPIPPSDILLHLIVALLAPMFLGVSAGDIRLARMAAIETINAYRAQTHADLITIAQIIAYGLAGLSSLSLSMNDDISLSMTLRLRGSATALNRAAEHNRRALRQVQTAPAPYHAHPDTPAETDDFPTDDQIILSVASAQQLATEAEARLRDPKAPGQQAPTPAPAIPVSAPVTAPPPATIPASAPIRASATAATTQDKRRQDMWAIAMVKQARELTASLPHLPPAERRTASIRAAALSSTAHELLCGAGTHPFPPASPGAKATPPAYPPGSAIRAI